MARDPCSSKDITAAIRSYHAQLANPDTEDEVHRYLANRKKLGTGDALGEVADPPTLQATDEQLAATFRAAIAGLAPKKRRKANQR